MGVAPIPAKNVRCFASSLVARETLVIVCMAAKQSMRPKVNLSANPINVCEHLRTVAVLASRLLFVRVDCDIGRVMNRDYHSTRLLFFCPCKRSAQKVDLFVPKVRIFLRTST